MPDSTSPHQRSKALITRAHLRFLAKVASQAREEFFRKNPEARSYQDRFVAAALCQGAALHYLHLGTGVKDFDIHLFYAQQPQRRQVARSVRRIPTRVPGFSARMVDIIHTVIPERFVAASRKNSALIIRSFLRARPTRNGLYVAQKPVIGLEPKPIFGRVIWPPGC